MSKIYFNKYIQLTSNAFSENKLLKSCFIAMLMISFINSIFIHNAINREKTIIIPAGFEFAFEISKNKANDLYYKQMARYLINLRGSVDSGNINNKFSELLTFVHPTCFGKLKEELTNIAKEYEKYTSISHNVIMQENILIKVVDNKSMIVQGIKERIVGDAITKKTPVEYKIDFKIEEGRFWLLDIKENLKNA